MHDNQFKLGRRSDTHKKRYRRSKQRHRRYHPPHKSSSRRKFVRILVCQKSADRIRDDFERRKSTHIEHVAHALDASCVRRRTPTFLCSSDKRAVCCLLRRN
uniref:Uncharacterized protein n=1 Tax=Cacopsylla melanoneura TaxID=428564 RepID=A0A8D9BV97_9HEMI